MQPNVPIDDLAVVAAAGLLAGVALTLNVRVLIRELRTPLRSARARRAIAPPVAPAPPVVPTPPLTRGPAGSGPFASPEAPATWATSRGQEAGLGSPGVQPGAAGGALLDGGTRHLMIRPLN